MRLENEFFEIEVAEIICGKDVSNDNFKNLKSLVKDNVVIWQRNK